VVVTLVAAVASGLTVATALPWLRRRPLDVPSARSSHTVPTPRGGGVGVVAGLAVGCAVGSALGHPPGWWVVVAAIALGMLGLAEDLHGLSVRVRLLAQLAVGLAVVAGLAMTERDPVWVVVAALLLVVLVNAYNFMDGINGISSLSAVIAAGWYAHLASNAEAGSLMVAGVALAGAAAGFLPWNLPRARVFLGDCGSYALGGGVGLLGLAVWLEGASVLAAVAPVLVYLTDVGWTLVWRVARREPWYEAHRQHVYQRLADAVGHLRASLAVATLSAVLCLSVVVLDSRSLVWLLLVDVVVVCAYLGTGTVLGQVRRPARQLR
jgi:UDP-N-acetylmuramyl pentapeptide phosphotransferase/UDP-N-acetylglucosamine-1-phosphate transferase